MSVKTWVVGAGGLVGSAVARTPGLMAFDSVKVPWATAAAPSVLGAEFDRFAEWVDGDDWGIVWAAGAGVMFTSQESLYVELEVFESFCEHLPGNLPQGRGGFYLISSAGGVYAGVSHPPFGPPATPPQPLNAYWPMKLAQEQRAIEALSSRLPVTVGRLSNADGPGQDLFKQGADHAAGSQPAAEPAGDDLRAAANPARLHLRRRRSEPRVTRRVVSSGPAASISELIPIVERISGRTFPVIHRLADGPYFLDLRLQASGDPDAGAQGTLLETGVALVFQDLLRQLENGRLAALV